MSNYLNEDDPDSSVTLPDGRVVRNLNAEAYSATYSSGTVHGADIPETDAKGDNES